MTVLDKMGKNLQNLGNDIASPFKKTGSGVEHMVNVAHNDIKGITKGSYKIASGLSNDVGTSLTNLTSPVGLISIAVVIGGIALISMSRK